MPENTNIIFFDEYKKLDKLCSEMYGKNRINEFIKSCMARNWLVTRLDVQNQVDIYTRAEEEIEFE